MASAMLVAHSLALADSAAGRVHRTERTARPVDRVASASVIAGDAATADVVAIVATRSGRRRARGWRRGRRVTPRSDRSMRSESRATDH